MVRSSDAEQLAVWLAENQPELFEGVLRTATRSAVPTSRGQLSGISDALSRLGTTFGSAVRNVGSFLTSAEGMKTLGAVGGLYLQSQAQKDALRLQMASVQAGAGVQPIQNVGVNTNSAVPVYTPTGQSLTPGLTQQLMPTTSMLPWGIGIAAAIALGTILLTRTR